MICFAEGGGDIQRISQNHIKGISYTHSTPFAEFGHAMRLPIHVWLGQADECLAGGIPACQINIP